jgi:periplasmic protein TonB
MSIDDIVKRPFQSQSAVIDLGWEPYPLRPDMAPAAAVEREACIPCEPGVGILAVKRERAAAVVLSLLFHLAVAVMAYLSVSEAMAPVIVEPPRVLHVTWVDAAHFSQNDVPAGHPKAAPAPAQAVAVQPVSKAHSQPPPPEKEKASAAPQEKQTTVLLAPLDRGAASGAAVQKTAAAQAGRNSMQIVALIRGLKTPGANNAADVSMAKPLYRENAPPPYPLSARIRGYEGVVLISAKILTEGRVGTLKIKSSSGYSILDQSALEAVKGWKFDPAKKMGKAVPAWVEIPVRYVLKSNR